MIKISTKVFPGPQNLALFVAEAKGYFDKHGIDADVQITVGADEQRAALNDRASEIALAEETLAIETARLEELRGELEGLLTKIDEARQADVERLVALYVNMKPREAATIMNDLDIEVAVTVLGAMPERDAAPVLAAMNVVRAQAISMIILERSKLPGDQRLNGIRLQ